MSSSEIIAGKVQFWLSVAILEFDIMNFSQAEIAAKRALQINPDCAEAYFHLGNILTYQGKLKKAINSYQQTIDLDSSFAKAYVCLGEIFVRQGRLKLALEYFYTALKHNPQAGYVVYYLSITLLKLCDWDNYHKILQELGNELESLIDGSSTYVPPVFNLNYFPLSSSLYTSVVRVTATKIEGKVAHLQKKLDFNYFAANNQQLKIGYLSGNFNQHPVGILLSRMFRHHNREQFEVTAYSNGKKKDSVTEVIKSGCDNFVDISNLSTEAAARQINQDKIDILIDLAGYTQGNRADILALQPAPIQAQWLGYPNTMGAKFVQYILADRQLISPAIAQYYTEKIIYLPQAFVASPLAISSGSITRQELGLPQDAFVFCCFNAHYKIEPQVFAVWMEILTQVPQSILWLREGAGKDNLIKEATKRNIAPNRLVFAPFISQEKYLARYALADLYLDTFIYNAGSTACAAIMGGVPLLTLQGNTNASRMGSSICASAGLDETICHSIEEYKNKAIYLASHPQELSIIRQRLSRSRLTQRTCPHVQNPENLPLFQLKNFVRQLEIAFQQMWSKFSQKN